MAISDAAISKDGVVASTGGVSKTFASLGSTLSQHNVFFDGVDLRTRSEAAFSTKAPKMKVDAPNGYTQARNNIVLKVPITLANGLITVNTVSLQMAYDVETSDAQKDTLISYAAQLLADTDMADFWKSQSIS